jgi:branched-chain amino acid transport system ATP-binding protein
MSQSQGVDEQINRVFETLPQLAALRNKTPFHLSGGERQLLALGMALTRHPKMIMLDEPSAGLSSVVWQQNIQIIRELNKVGISFLIVEHRLEGLREIADQAYLVKLGRMEREK